MSILPMPEETLHLDYHHLDRHMLGQSDGGLEVHCESHQQIDNGHQVL